MPFLLKRKHSPERENSNRSSSKEGSPEFSHQHKKSDSDLQAKSIETSMPQLRKEAEELSLYKKAEELSLLKNELSSSPIFEHNNEDKDEDHVEESDSSVNKDENKKSGKSYCRLLPKEAVETLKEWMFSPEHFSFPYPTEEEKKMLMNKTGLNSKQIKYWFINARRRIWKEKFLEKQHEEEAQKMATKGKNIPTLPTLPELTLSTDSLAGTDISGPTQNATWAHPQQVAQQSAQESALAFATASALQHRILANRMAIAANLSAAQSSALAVSQQTAAQHVLTQHAINHALNQQALNHQAMAQHALNQHALNQLTMGQTTVVNQTHPSPPQVSGVGKHEAQALGNLMNIKNFFESRKPSSKHR